VAWLIVGLVGIKVEIKRLNVKDEVLEQPQIVEYSLEQLDYVSQKEKVLLQIIQRIYQGMWLESQL
jgi:hypothetical protein